MTQHHRGWKTSAFNLLVTTLFPPSTFSPLASVSLDHPGVALFAPVLRRLSRHIARGSWWAGAGVLSRCLRCVAPAVRSSLLRNLSGGFTTAGGVKENSCIALVTSTRLIRFDAHSEQIGLSLDKIKVFKPLLLSYFIWHPLWECNVTVVLAPVSSKPFHWRGWLGQASNPDCWSCGEMRRMSAPPGLRAILRLCERLGCLLTLAANTLHQFSSNEIPKRREIRIWKSRVLGYGGW